MKFNNTSDGPLDVNDMEIANKINFQVDKYGHLLQEILITVNGHERSELVRYAYANKAMLDCCNDAVSIAGISLLVLGLLAQIPTDQSADDAIRAAFDKATFLAKEEVIKFLLASSSQKFS